MEDAVLEEERVTGAQAEIDGPVGIDSPLGNRQGSRESVRTGSEQRESRTRFGEVGQTVADLDARAEHPRVPDVLGHADVPMPRPSVAIGLILRPLVDDRGGVQMEVGRQELYHQGHGGGVGEQRVERRLLDDARPPLHVHLFPRPLEVVDQPVGRDRQLGYLFGCQRSSNDEVAVLVEEPPSFVVEQGLFHRHRSGSSAGSRSSSRTVVCGV